VSITAMKFMGKYVLVVFLVALLVVLVYMASLETFYTKLNLTNTSTYILNVSNKLSIASIATSISAIETELKSQANITEIEAEVLNHTTPLLSRNLTCIQDLNILILTTSHAWTGHERRSTIRHTWGPYRPKKYNILKKWQTFFCCWKQTEG